MQLLRLLIVAGLLSCSAVTPAASKVPVPAKRQLMGGITADEATALIEKLRVTQDRLKAGERLQFELLAGSIASYEMTKASPRDVFLKVRFDEVWEIQRVPTDNQGWQPYRLAYAPDGLGQLYWDIEVILGFNGEIERVLMLYKPPAPF